MYGPEGPESDVLFRDDTRVSDRSATPASIRRAGIWSGSRGLWYASVASFRDDVWSCRCSSVAEQPPRKRQAVSSNLTIGSKAPPPMW